MPCGTRTSSASSTAWGSSRQSPFLPQELFARILDDTERVLALDVSAEGTAVFGSGPEPGGGLQVLPALDRAASAPQVLERPDFLGAHSGLVLLERRDLRDRLIGLFGHGRLSTTTKAFDEAGTRVSRQLLMQTLVNVLYGIVAGVGLYLLGVPYALVWAVLGALLRFVPYVGPVLGAGAPILVSLAALEGWIGPLAVAGLFVALELFTNLVLETVLYAGRSRPITGITSACWPVIRVKPRT